MNVAFVTHFCPHYRVKTFEMLAQIHDVEYFFYSQGNEWYGQGIHGVRGGNFRHTYLPGFQLTRRTRVTPSLLTDLWRKDYDVFVKCINGRFALPATYLVARLRGIPFVLWTGIWMTLQTPFHRLAFPLTRWIYRHADAIAVYGEHVKRYLVEQGIQDDKIFVAAHAVDNSLYSRPVSPENKARLKTDLSVERRKVVLYLGRLEEIKGLDYLIRAFARLSFDGAILVLAGDGSLSESLMALAQQLGIRTNTRFAGYVSPEDAQVYYAVADVFVLPSVEEGSALVTYEAQACGCVLAVSDATGARCEHRRTGLVHPARDVDALAAHLRELEGDPALLARLRAATVARLDELTWDRSAEQQAGVYAAALAGDIGASG